MNYRAADAYEEVTVTPSELRVKKVTHKGKVSEWSLNPLWMRLERETHEEFGLMRLLLVSRGRRLAVGSFLGPDEKESFAAALAAAIGEAKRGPTRADDPAKCGTRSRTELAGKPEIGWFAVPYRPK